MKLKPPLSADDIRKLLPHRWPFLLLDRVVELEPGRRAVGIKNVAVSEPYFAGHFPAESIMPGVLIVECLAQLTAVAYTTGALVELEQAAGGQSMADVDISAQVGYLVAIKNMKFRRPVSPGDRLVLECLLGSSLGILTSVQVSARCEGELVAEGSLVVSRRPEKEQSYEAV
ncbi:MAG: 3-hydroxyacyl-ACP dehydratase FabZ [Desulfurispora sp.]|uniref:3-hydroxyacyl-ACP dehydratase FabZ n=1 Tax=Desulfurispora sp. TaxID=3014275 RepID=UPI00404B5A71